MCCLNVWPSASLQLYIVAHCDEQLHAPDLIDSRYTQVKSVFRDDYKKEVENKTLLQQMVPGDK